MLITSADRGRSRSVSSSSVQPEEETQDVILDVDNNAPDISSILVRIAVIILSFYLSALPELFTLVRLIMTGNIVAGKNNGGYNL